MNFKFAISGLCLIFFVYFNNPAISLEAIIEESIDCGSTINATSNITLLSITEINCNDGTPCNITIFSEENTTIHYLFSNFSIDPSDLVVLFDVEQNRSFSFSSDSQILGNHYITDSSSIIEFISQCGKNTDAGRQFFSVEIKAQSHGGYFVNEGNFSCKPSTNVVENETYYLLTSDDTKQIVVHLSNYSTDTKVDFYDGQNPTEENKLASFASKEDVYDVFSISNKMLIKVTSNDHEADPCLDGNFKSIDKEDNLLSLSRGHSGSYQLTDVKNENYMWLVKPMHIDSSDEISFTIHSLSKLGGRYLQIRSGLGDDLPQIRNFSSVAIERTFYASASSGIRVDYVLGDPETNTDANGVLSMSYEVIPKCAFVVQELAPLVTSPGYPTKYPFDASCNWQLAKSVVAGKVVHVSFLDFDVYDADSLTIKDKFQKQVVSSTDDLIYNSDEFNLMFQSSFEGIDKLPHRGFNLNLEILECGASYNKPSDHFETPDNSTSTHCIWRLDIPETSPGNIKVTINVTNSQTKNGDLTVYDGGKIGSGTLPVNSVDGTQTLISKTNKMLFVLKFPKQAQAATTYNIDWNYQTCNSNKTCHNGICMHEDWKCNGINDCGDYSDEDLCVPYDCGEIVNFYDVHLLSPNVEQSNKTLNCQWLVKSNSTGTASLVIQVKSLELINDMDILILSEGKGSSRRVLSKFTNNSIYDESILVTSGNELLVELISNQTNAQQPTFILNITSQENGYYNYGKGEVKISNQTEPEYVAFETDADKQVQVLLDVSSQSIPYYQICFYDGFQTNTNLGCFGVFDESYPIVSNGNRMLVFASGFMGANSANLKATSVDSGYHHFYDDLVGNLILRSSTHNKYIWRIKPSVKGVIVFTMKKLDLEPGEFVVVKEGMLDEDQNILNIDHSLDSPYVLHANAEKGLVIIYDCKHNSIDSASATFDASYEVVPAEEFNRVVPLEIKGSHYVVTSPGYPNQYPINADCSWKFTRSNTTSFVHLLIEDLELSSAHKLFITAENKTIMTLSGSELPDDLIITESKFDITWSSVQDNRSTEIEKLGKGFKIKVTPLACGGNLTKDSSTIQMTPENATIECLWIITGHNQHSMIEFQINPQHENANATLFIHDGGSARSHLFDNTTTDTALLSESNKLLIRYDFYANVSSNGTDIAFKIPYTVHSCENKTEQCGNGNCMHPDWKCDGINDCGDNTDELDCYEPAGLTVTKNEGVSSGWLVAAIFISLIVGALLGYVVIPIGVKKYRDWRATSPYQSIYGTASESET